MTAVAESAPEAAPEPAPAAEAKPALTVKLPPGGDDIYRGERLPARKTRGTDIYRGRRLPAYKNVPDYAIDHGEQKNKMLSDEEIGWVD